MFRYQEFIRCVYFCWSITLIRFQDILVLCHTRGGVSEALTDLYVWNTVDKTN